MAKHDPAGDVDEASPVPFGDPFGPYPEQPYPGSAPVADTPADDDIDPPTDPALPVVTADDGFDPFAPDAFWFPERPWYRKKQATLAFAAIGVAGVAILIAAVLLVALDSDDSEPSTTTPSTSTSLPTTTALTSSQPSEPPPPPPPPPESPPPAPPQGTWYPRYPQQNDGGRPNVTTPQTRPPQISVRPTHRPAFPNQPGGG
ncbi:hypothetical protein [Mycobacterium sp. SA01]|uniref:hypothetical protein n=1 Tax=Mycobacterium sp. SA01 TaxID=3238820 RepID=UPI00351B2988